MEDEGEKFEKFKFILDKKSKNCLFHSLNTKDKLILSEKRFLKTNDIYKIDTDALHSVRQLNTKISISLVYQASDERDYSILYAKNDAFSDAIKPSINEFKKILEKTLERLNQGQESLKV
ncbi:MAG: hypothetical protein AAF617_06925 [Bacteroidota bacterium]